MGRILIVPLFISCCLCIYNFLRTICMFGNYVYFLFSSVLRPIFRENTETKMEEVPSKQIINFSGIDADPTFAVHSRDVEVISASGTTTNGDSRMKATNMVDYSWEERFYTGQMLAVHRSGKYIAYGIKVKSKAQCSIRIVNKETTNRSLMKDAEGMIEDLSFAQSPDVILLACIDNTGTLFVYHITEDITEITFTLVLHVVPAQPPSRPIPYRVFWSASVPDDEVEDDDAGKLLAVTRNNKVELWNISTVSPDLKLVEGPIKSGDIKEGYLVIEAHDDLITEAVFSPDGTAIATASLDGTCKFYQVYMPPGEAESRCLHQWSPHHGRAVTMLLFLDDFTKFNPEVPFWKYAITATDNNSELSLWSCETWQRLQHIKIKNGSDKKKFKIGLDISASIIVINDMPNKILYILELNKREVHNTIPYVVAVTELRLHYSIISFGIVEAWIGPHQPNMSPALNQSTVRVNGENGDELGVMIRMYIVQPKSLQSCDVIYPTKRANIIPSPSPELSEDYENGEILYDNGVSNSEEDTKSDVPIEKNPVDELPLEQEVVSCIPLTPPKPSLNLMTPEAFSRSVEQDDTELSGIEELTATDSCVDPPPASSPLPDQPENNPSQLKSGSSSPSREVEEILAQKEMNYFDKEPHAQQQTSPQQIQQDLSQSLNNTCITFEDKSCGTGTNISENQEMKNDISNLCLMLKRQNEEIQELRNCIKSMESQGNNLDLMRNMVERYHNVISEQLSSHQNKVESQISRHLNITETFHNHLVGTITSTYGETEKLHKNIIEKMNRHQEESISHICQLVGNSISTKLPPMIQSQLLNCVTPAMKELKDQMHKELTIKLTATDILLKDNISKMIKSKALMDTLASGVSAVGKESVAIVCKDALDQALPKIEQVCSTMMSDMAETFTNGTTQYVSEVESQLKRLTEHWHFEVSKLHTSFLEQSKTQTIKLIDKSLHDLEDRLLKKLGMIVVKAVNTGVTNRVMTPAIGSILQGEIAKLIDQGHLSDAFQQALSASDLPLVMYVCEKVPIDLIFTGKGSLLSQPSLLSLIQQLSSDMSTYNKTKHNYIAEAIMNLNPRTAVTREHMPNILSSLEKQLEHFIVNNAGSPLTKDVRMLQMATKSLLNA